MNYKFSIITPEHKKENIPFLLELYETIKSQTYSNWEWVLYLNGNCKVVKCWVARDSHSRTTRARAHGQGTGARCKGGGYGENAVHRGGGGSGNGRAYLEASPVRSRAIG